MTGDDSDNSYVEQQREQFLEAFAVVPIEELEALAEQWAAYQFDCPTDVDHDTVEMCAQELREVLEQYE